MTRGNLLYDFVPPLFRRLGWNSTSVLTVLNGSAVLPGHFSCAPQNPRCVTRSFMDAALLGLSRVDLHALKWASGKTRGQADSLGQMPNNGIDRVLLCFRQPFR
jgi:hypothetical protein